ncbi:MAG: NFACT RNA binding domain-containing protein [Planctomycetota bacterium]
MPFSAADLERVLDEAGPRLVRARVRRVRSRGRAAAIELRDASGRETALLLDPLAAVPSLLALPREAVSPTGEPALGFSDTLRGAIEGRALAAIELVAGDRIVRFDFEGGASLAVHLTGRWADALLIGSPADSEEAGPIVRASLRRTHEGKGPRAGQPYVEPEPRKQAGAALLRPDVEPDTDTLSYSVALREDLAVANEAAEQARIAQGVRRGLSSRLKRARGACRKLEQAVEASKQASEVRRAGELLLIHLHRLEPRQERITLEDVYEEGSPERTIELDPERPPKQQAERYFKRARKLERGAKVSAERLAERMAEAERLEAGIAALHRGEDPQAVAVSLGVKVPSAGGVQTDAPRRGKAKQPSIGARRFTSRDGLAILVGRSDQENDQLTLRVAKGKDLFFHVANLPGSHVIVRAEGKSVPRETLLDAAALAVYYSKARGRPKADVIYAERRFVRKPKGAPAGRVQVQRGDPLLYEQDPARLQRVLNTNAGK